MTTEIEDIGIGSIWTKIKLNFKDIIAKEETKEVLTKAKEAVISHYLEKPIVEVSKTQSEKSKIDSETEILKRELLNYDSPERKIIIDIDIESKKLDNRKRLADIESQELDNKMKRLNLIDTVAALAAKGILSVDHVQIDINEVLFLLKEGSDISSGTDL